MTISAAGELVIGAFGVLPPPMPQGAGLEPPHAVALTEVVEAPPIPGDLHEQVGDRA